MCSVSLFTTFRSFVPFFSVKELLPCPKSVHRGCGPNPQAAQIESRKEVLRDSQNEGFPVDEKFVLVREKHPGPTPILGGPKIIRANYKRLADIPCCFEFSINVPLHCDPLASRLAQMAERQSRMDVCPGL